MTSRSFPRERDDLAFLRVDSDSRIGTYEALQNQHFMSPLNQADAQRAHVIIAEYLEQISDQDVDFRALAEYLNRALANESRRSPANLRLIDARVTYEHFFDGEPRWHIEGWSTDLVTLASDLYSRSSLEIAATVWWNDRTAAKAQYATSSVKLPQLEFDHQLLGSGRFALLPNEIGEHEPFFEMSYPVIGVCGVKSAWMYQEARDIDQFGIEILDYLASDCPDLVEAVVELDLPITDRPLGFESTRYAAESLLRHLTIKEGAENLVDRLIKRSKMPIDSSQISLESQNLNRYMHQVLSVGFLARPAILDYATVNAHASELAGRLADSYQRRENIFSAWIRYIDYAKFCGVAMREFGQECYDIRSLFETQIPASFFTADKLRRSVDLLNQGYTPVNVASQLSVEQVAPAEPTDARVIRVSGVSSPAIVVERKKPISRGL